MCFNKERELGASFLSPSYFVSERFFYCLILQLKSIKALYIQLLITSNSLCNGMYGSCG